MLDLQPARDRLAELTDEERQAVYDVLRLIVDALEDDGR